MRRESEIATDGILASIRSAAWRVNISGSLDQYSASRSRLCLYRRHVTLYNILCRPAALLTVTSTFTIHGAAGTLGSVTEDHHAPYER